jgi:hypothetical protein
MRPEGGSVEDCMGSHIINTSPVRDARGLSVNAMPGADFRWAVDGRFWGCDRLAMDSIFSAMFEGALIFNAGVPVRQMYDHLRAVNSGDEDVVALIEDLKSDWDLVGDPDQLKMVAPFVRRAKDNPDYGIGAGFAELGAYTSMVDTYWKYGCYTYVLKKRLLRFEADAHDLALARTLLGTFPLEHPVVQYLLSISSGPLWTSAQLNGQGEPSMTFKGWVDARQLAVTSCALPCRDVIAQEGERMGYREIVDKAQAEWDLYTTALRG